MRGSRRNMSLVAGLALLTGAGCHDSKEEMKTRAALELAALKAQAGRACSCEQRGGAGAKKACWAEFEAAMARKHATPSGTSCLPVHAEGRCWSAKEQRPPSVAADGCMTVQYQAVLFSGDQVPLCTEQQAKAAEAAWYQGAEESPDFTTHNDAPHPRRDAADAEIRRIARGEPVVTAPSDIPSCI
jgi:hypothetical protein